MIAFNASAEAPRRVSPGQLQALLSVYQQDLLTGLVRLSLPQSKEDFVILLYAEGQIIRLYQHLAHGYVRHEPISRNAILPKVDADLQAYQFPARFLRPLQGLFEQTRVIDETLTVSTPNVVDTVRRLEKSAEPLLAHFHWPNADGFVLVPGNGLTSRQLMFWSPGQPTTVPNFFRWGEPECTLTTYAGNMESKAWRENYLMMGLDFLYEKIFQRYDDLVGASMVSRLEEQLNSVSRMQGWKISFAGRALEDNHFFSSLGDMRIAYRSLLLAGQRHISAVVGERLFEETLFGAVNTLSPTLRTTLQMDNILNYQTR